MTSHSSPSSSPSLSSSSSFSSFPLIAKRIAANGWEYFIDTALYFIHTAAAGSSYLCTVHHDDCTERSAFLMSSQIALDIHRRRRRRGRQREGTARTPNPNDGSSSSATTSSGGCVGSIRRIFASFLLLAQHLHKVKGGGGDGADLVAQACSVAVSRMEEDDTAFAVGSSFPSSHQRPVGRSAAHRNQSGGGTIHRMFAAPVERTFLLTQELLTNRQRRTLAHVSSLITANCQSALFEASSPLLGGCSGSPIADGWRACALLTQTPITLYRNARAILKASRSVRLAKNRALFEAAKEGNYATVKRLLDEALAHRLEARRRRRRKEGGQKQILVGEEEEDFADWCGGNETAEEDALDAPVADRCCRPVYSSGLATPLHIAVERGHAAIVELILHARYGAFSHRYLDEDQEPSSSSAPKPHRLMIEDEATAMNSHQRDFIEDDADTASLSSSGVGIEEAIHHRSDHHHHVEVQYTTVGHDRRPDTSVATTAPSSAATSAASSFVATAEDLLLLEELNALTSDRDGSGGGGEVAEMGPVPTDSTAAFCVPSPLGRRRKEVMMRDAHGSTPLHTAVGKPFKRRIMLALLAAGADTCARDGMGGGGGDAAGNYYGDGYSNTLADDDSATAPSEVVGGEAEVRWRGAVPLHLASVRGDVRAVAMLLEADGERMHRIQLQQQQMAAEGSKEPQGRGGEGEVLSSSSQPIEAQPSDSSSGVGGGGVSHPPNDNTKVVRSSSISRGISRSDAAFLQCPPIAMRNVYYPPAKKKKMKGSDGPPLMAMGSVVRRNSESSEEEAAIGIDSGADDGEDTVHSAAEFHGDSGSDCDESDDDGDGATPLALAVVFNRPAVARLLIAHGATDKTASNAMMKRERNIKCWMENGDECRAPTFHAANAHVANVTGAAEVTKAPPAPPNDGDCDDDHDDWIGGDPPLPLHFLSSFKPSLLHMSLKLRDDPSLSRLLLDSGVCDPMLRVRRRVVDRRHRHFAAFLLRRRDHPAMCRNRNRAAVLPPPSQAQLRREFHAVARGIEAIGQRMRTGIAMMAATAPSVAPLLAESENADEGTAAERSLGVFIHYWQRGDAQNDAENEDDAMMRADEVWSRTIDDAPPPPLSPPPPMLADAPVLAHNALMVAASNNRYSAGEVLWAEMPNPRQIVV